MGGYALRHRLQFLRQQTGVHDGYGNRQTTFVPLFGLWGNFRETLGREVVVSGRVEAKRTGTIRLRSGAQARGLTEADRVRVRGMDWDIRSIAQADDRGRLLDILVEAVVS